MAPQLEVAKPAMSSEAEAVATKAVARGGERRAASARRAIGATSEAARPTHARPRASRRGAQVRREVQKRRLKIPVNAATRIPIGARASMIWSSGESSVREEYR